MTIIEQWLVITLIFVLYWSAGYIYYKKCKSEVLIWKDIAKKERDKKAIDKIALGICKFILVLMAAGVLIYVFLLLTFIYGY